MSIQRKKLNIGKARRRVQTRSALLLTAGSCVLVSFVRLLLAADIPYILRWLLEMLTTLTVFGGGAYLGLCVLDGDHRKIVPLKRLSRGQIRWLILLGVLATAPLALARDLIAALFEGQNVFAFVPAMDCARFTAMFVKSVLLTPVCEELFFRGYLFPALKPQGNLRAAVVVSLCFALVHAAGIANSCAYVLLSLLLCWIALHTQSLVAPVIVHACYNLALLVMGSAGLSGLMSGWSLISCVIRLALSAAFVFVLKKAYLARPAGGMFALWEGGKPEKREILLFVCAGLLLFATLIMGG